MELRLHHAISMNQATVNQGFALPVVFQLSIHFDLRVPVCDHLIFHEMMFCEHGERSKRHNQMRKIYGKQARETDSTDTELLFAGIDVTKTAALLNVSSSDTLGCSCLRFLVATAIKRCLTGFHKKAFLWCLSVR